MQFTPVQHLVIKVVVRWMYVCIICHCVHSVPSPVNGSSYSVSLSQTITFLLDVPPLTHTPFHLHTKRITEFSCTTARYYLIVSSLPFMLWIFELEFTRWHENNSYANMSRLWCACVPVSISCIKLLCLYLITVLHTPQFIDENEIKRLTAMNKNLEFIYSCSRKYDVLTSCKSISELHSSMLWRFTWWNTAIILDMQLQHHY